jgi:hypothetical protein
MTGPLRKPSLLYNMVLKELKTKEHVSDYKIVRFFHRKLSGKPLNEGGRTRDLTEFNRWARPPSAQQHPKTSFDELERP